MDDGSNAENGTCGVRIVGWTVAFLVLSGCGVDEVQPTGDAYRGQQQSPDTGVAEDLGEDVRGDTTSDDTGRADTGRDVNDASGPKGPPYPIVLSHGFGGFEHLVDVEEFSYYFQIPELLEEAGESVYVAEVDPFNDSYTRGRQLLDQIEAYLDETGYEQVNIIAHSQGGLDSRWVAHQAPDKVASVVTISSPHHGTLVSDVTLGFVDYPFYREVLDATAKIVGATLYDESGDETSAMAALRQFSEDGIEEFNDRVTDQPGVFYASVAGRTDDHLGRERCRTEHAPEFIEAWRYDGDPVDPILAATETLLDGSAESEPNDGMVRVKNAKWGRFLGCIPADHLDEVGHLLGDSPGGGNAWDYRQFYLDLVEYLHDEGY